MPPKRSVKYTPVAVDDMDEIFSYISRDNIPAAEDMLQKLDKHIGRLAEFPNMGSVLFSEVQVRRRKPQIRITPYGIK